MRAGFAMLLGSLCFVGGAAADATQPKGPAVTCASTRCGAGLRCVDTAAGARCARRTAGPASAAPAANPCALVRCARGTTCEAGARGARCVPPAASPLSHVGQHVLNALQSTAPQHRGRSWGMSQDNRFAADWMLFTPRLFGRTYADLSQAVTCTSGANCNTDFGLRRCRANADCGGRNRCEQYLPTVSAPGQTAESLCVGHSDVWVQRLYQLIANAQRFVDITSLTVPDGRYYAAIKNAIAFVSHKPQAIVVRALFGSFPVQGEVKAKEMVADWTQRAVRGTKTRVYVGGYRSSNVPPSWNHSKIVAVDGQTVMSGGHNMWAKQYLGINPVNDMSMIVSGGAAAEGHRFVNAQWAWTCAHFGKITNATGQARIASFENGAMGKNCPAQFEAASPAGVGGATVFSLGRLARIDPKQTANQGDTAILASIASARRMVRIAQQDVGPPSVPYLGLALGNWPAPLFDELGHALMRGAEVQLVLSNLNAKAGGLPMTEATYSNGYSAKKVLQKIREHMQKGAGFPKDKALDTLLCGKLTIANWRYSAEQSYPNAEPIPNHSKTLVIDDTAFYIGSQNMYEAGLTEHGFLVDDVATTQSYMQQYWQPLWASSSKTAVSGPGVSAAACARALDGSFLTRVTETLGQAADAAKTGLNTVKEKAGGLVKKVFTR